MIYPLIVDVVLWDGQRCNPRNRFGFIIELLFIIMRVESSFVVKLFFSYRIFSVVATTSAGSKAKRIYNPPTVYGTEQADKTVAGFCCHHLIRTATR